MIVSRQFNTYILTYQLQLHVTKRTGEHNTMFCPVNLVISNATTHNDLAKSSLGMRITSEGSSTCHFHLVSNVSIANYFVFPLRDP